jgi:hypothetical protein
MSGTHNSQSRSVRLALRLFELGIIPRGKFTLVEAKHDHGCPTLVTGSGHDCNCDCEIEIGGRTYSYWELVRLEKRL